METPPSRKKAERPDELASNSEAHLTPLGRVGDTDFLELRSESTCL